MSNTSPIGLGPKLNEYTVVAVYEDDFQPYATTVLCATPDEAMALAQECADEANGAHIALNGFQVIAGAVEIIA